MKSEESPSAPPPPRHPPWTSSSILFDQIAKKIGKEALDASGLTVVEDEISRGAQHADLYHEPDPRRQAERARLGLLGRIAAFRCLIEVYGHAPRGCGSSRSSSGPVGTLRYSFPNGRGASA